MSRLRWNSNISYLLCNRLSLPLAENKEYVSFHTVAGVGNQEQLGGDLARLQLRSGHRALGSLIGLQVCDQDPMRPLLLATQPSP